MSPGAKERVCWGANDRGILFKNLLKKYIVTSYPPARGRQTPSGQGCELQPMKMTHGL